MVYLLHFSAPYWHARHYIGYAVQPKRRLRHHLNGTGANLPHVVHRAGIELILARLWRGKHADRNFERRLKNYKKTRLLCPICSGRKAHKRMSIRLIFLDN